MTIEESKQLNFTCTHSGESFNLGDECWGVWADRLLLEAVEEKIDEDDLKGLYPYIAYFHTKEKALEWNNNKFGGKIK